MGHNHFFTDFRKFFFRGLGALVPTLVTFAILVWAYKLVNDNVGYFITNGLRELCSMVRAEPAPGLVDPFEDALKFGEAINEWDDEGRRLTTEYKVLKNHRRLEETKSSLTNLKVLSQARAARNEVMWQLAFAKYKLHFLGFLIAIILVYFTGFFLASFLGRTSWRAAERLLNRVPVIRAIYPNIKQVTDFLLTDRNVEFSGVVAVEYPRKGVWSVGLSTGGPMKQVQGRVSDELVSVFIPSSPTPITGYVVQVPRQDVIELNMTIDEGLRFTISGGVIKPGEMLPGTEAE